MSTTSGVQGITENDIAQYLANTPAFFERSRKRDIRKARVAPRVEAKETMTVPPSSPKTAPPASVRSAAPGNERAVTMTYTTKYPAMLNSGLPVRKASMAAC